MVYVSKHKNSCDCFYYLADSTDAHVQGLGVTASPIQDLWGQLHHEARALSFALESAGVVRVVVHRQPLVVLTLVAHVCMSWTLLGAKIPGIWRAILRVTTIFLESLPSIQNHSVVERWVFPQLSVDGLLRLRPLNFSLSLKLLHSRSLNYTP